MNNDEIPAPGDANNANESTAQPRTPVLPKGTGAKEDHQESKQHKTYSEYRKKRTMNILKRLWRWVKRGTLPEWITVLITAVIAVIGGLQLSVYRAQKKIMESSGHQTEQLISAANIQAYAATKNADSAEKMAGAADKQASAAINLVKQITASANLAYGPKIHLSEWTPFYHCTRLVATCVAGERIWVTVRFQNTGQNDPKALNIAARLQFHNTDPRREEYSLAFRPAEPFKLWQPPINKENLSETDQDISKDRGRGTRLYIWGTFRYQVFAGEWDTPYIEFCRYVPADIVLARSQGTKDGYSGAIDCETPSQ